MEIITAYFVSRQQALEASKYLRNKGFKGEVSILGRNEEEGDIGKTENMMSNIDNVSGNPNYGLSLGFGGVPIGLAALMLQGSGQMLMGGPFAGILIGSLRSEVNQILTHWGVPRDKGEEIKRVIDSGNSVILIKSEENEKQFINDTLLHEGAQNIS